MEFFSDNFFFGSIFTSSVFFLLLASATAHNITVIMDQMGERGSPTNLNPHFNRFPPTEPQQRHTIATPIGEGEDQAVNDFLSRDDCAAFRPE